MKASKINPVKLLLLLMCMLLSVSVWAQNQQIDLPPLPESKRFIDKVEIIAGPGFSFNHGNKFVDNYKDANVQNKRYVKAGYLLGVGVYHPFRNWLDINLRLLYEEKGSKSKMNTPDLEIKPEYTFKYFTVCLTPRIFVDKAKHFSLSLGGYYSVLKRSMGDEVVYSKPDVFEEKFNGRHIRTLRSDGSVQSLTFAPGLKSFEKNDYGINVRLGYILNLKGVHNISIEITDNFGLQNINKPVDNNLPEKNHSIYAVIGYVLQRPDRE